MRGTFGSLVIGTGIGMLVLANPDALAVGSTPVTVVNPMTSPVPVVDVGSAVPIVPVMAYINFTGSNFLAYTVPANKTLVVTDISYNFAGWTNGDVPTLLELFAEGPPSIPMLFLPVVSGVLSRGGTYVSIAHLSLRLYVPAGTKINIITDGTAAARLVMMNGYLIGN